MLFKRNQVFQLRKDFGYFDAKILHNTLIVLHLKTHKNEMTLAPKTKPFFLKDNTVWSCLRDSHYERKKVKSVKRWFRERTGVQQVEKLKFEKSQLNKMDWTFKGRNTQECKPKRSPEMW